METKQMATKCRMCGEMFTYELHRRPRWYCSDKCAHAARRCTARELARRKVGRELGDAAFAPIYDEIVRLQTQEGVSEQQKRQDCIDYLRRTVRPLQSACVKHKIVVE